MSILKARPHSEDERVDTARMLGLVVVGERFPRLGKVGAE